MLLLERQRASWRSWLEWVVSIEVGTFTNYDTHALVRLWADHYKPTQIPTSCPTNVWEYCVLSKSFFDPSTLWVVRDKSVPKGFLHASTTSNHDGSDVGPTCGLINALCVTPSENDAELAAALLLVANEWAKQQNFQSLLATSSPENFAFYMGIAPGDGLLGVPNADLRLQQWLQNDGFDVQSATTQWITDLRMFRAPMDRTQMQVRRLCQVSRILEDISGPWWLASSLGHTEQVRFQLTSRQPPFQTLEALYWQPDSTIHGIGNLGMQMGLPKPTGEPELSERIVLLAAESLRQLQQDHVPQVRAITYDSDEYLHKVLLRLGFHPELQGRIFSKHLA